MTRAQRLQRLKRAQWMTLVSVVEDVREDEEFPCEGERVCSDMTKLDFYFQPGSLDPRITILVWREGGYAVPFGIALGADTGFDVHGEPTPGKHEVFERVTMLFLARWLRGTISTVEHCEAAQLTPEQRCSMLSGLALWEALALHQLSKCPPARVREALAALLARCPAENRQIAISVMSAATQHHTRGISAA